jgi:hypothetical protein
MNPDYTLILTSKYPGSTWTLDGDDYDGLVWLSDTPQPTKAELDALWPQVQYEQQVASVEAARLVAYEHQSDPLFFKWQRGDATELEWREAVAKVKAENPYPPAP